MRGRIEKWMILCEKIVKNCEVKFFAGVLEELNMEIFWI